MEEPSLPVPTVSVVIPFYNSGEYIVDAVDSVEQCPEKASFEIIIVNDGSTDAESLRALDRIGAERGHRVIHQTNQGPAAARNTGIRAARGRYLLLLDSDNKIRPRYIAVGIDILDRNPRVGVVHGNAAFFGTSDLPRFKARPFDLKRIIAHNYIDNCAVVRKSAWQDIGGFDENRILIGHEDWEFWIRMGAAGWQFHHADETLFDYRVRGDSLVNSISSTKREEMHRYVVSKHLPLVVAQYAELLKFRLNPPLYLLKKLYRLTRRKKLSQAASG